MNSYTWRAGILKSDLAPTTRHVLLTLSCHINDAGESAYPSVETLVRETGLSKPAVVKHLAVAKAAGWLVVLRHGFGGQKWARHEYYPAFPEGGKASLPRQEKGGKPRLPRSPEGGKPGSKKAVNEVNLNYSYELPLEPTVIRGGSSRTPRACDPPPPEGEDRMEGIEQEVERIKRLHLDTCGLNTLPPLAIVREILQGGKPASLIDDVYQAYGGDILKYRQRNIVEQLKALRDGVERSPPSMAGDSKAPGKRLAEELAEIWQGGDGHVAAGS